MEDVVIPPEFISSFKKFRANFSAANEMYRQLQDHIGEYVVISDGKVMGYEDSYEKAMRKYGSISGIFIDLISKENIFWIL